MTTRSSIFGRYRRDVPFPRLFAVVATGLVVLVQGPNRYETVAAAEQPISEYTRRQVQALNDRSIDWSLFGKYRFAPNGRFKCEQLNAVWSDCHIDVVDQSERIKDRLDVVIFEHAGAVDGLHDTAFPEQVVRDSKTVAIGRKQYTADCRFDRSEEPPATRCIIDLDRHIAVAGMGVGRASFQRLQMLTFLGAAWAMTQAKVPR